MSPCREKKPLFPLLQSEKRGARFENQEDDLHQTVHQMGQVHCLVMMPAGLGGVFPVSGDPELLDASLEDPPGNA